MDGLVTLADIPELSGERSPRSQITVARLGKYQDPRYGKFEIGEADFAGWQRNLTSTFGGKVSVDFDHSSDRGRGTEAAAWITGLERQGKDLVADVEWTPKGAAAVRDGAYRFFSPTYVANYKTERGEDRGNALLGGALTNRPVLRELPTLSLSREEIDGVATIQIKGSAKRERKRARELSRPRDSRAQMADLSQVAKLLGLDESADLESVLAGVATLADPGNASAAIDAAAKAKKASKKAKKLARKGKSKQTTTLSALSDDQLAQLLLDANAGASAATQLAEQTFTHAWEKALSEGRAAPAQEETLRELHKTSPELAIKTLDSFVKIVPTTPTGSGEAGANAGPAPLGMDDDRFALHTEAKQLAEQKRKADPDLDEAEAYSLAAIEIEERKFTMENGGF